MALVVKFVILNPLENAFCPNKQEEKVRWKAGQPGFASVFKQGTFDETDLQEEALPGCAFFGKSRATGNTE